jgi:hypothetical protein
MTLNPRPQYIDGADIDDILDVLRDIRATLDKILAQMKDDK